MNNEQYGILRIEKYTKGSVRGIENHDLRLAKASKTNGDIDYSRTHNNYELWNRNGESFNRAVSKRIAQLKLKKAIRRDAIVMCQAMCTASPDFFKNKTPEEIKKYFEDCLNFLSKKYGKDNIVSATVHMDEKTPHMHVNFVPITTDNRLCAKDLFKKWSLRNLQDQAHSQVFDKYELKRGNKDKIKHISTLNLKIITLQNKEHKLQQELLALQQKRDTSELYQLRNQLQKTRSMLSQMFEVLESDEKLMKEYKIAVEKYKQAKNRNMEEQDIEK